MARNPGTPKGASFINPATKPVDVAYRVKRLLESLAEANKFLHAINPDVFPENVHGKIADHLDLIRSQAAQLEYLRPPTRTEVKAAYNDAAETASLAAPAVDPAPPAEEDLSSYVLPTE